MRTQIPLLICAIAGIFMAVQYFIPATLPVYDRMNDYLQIVYAFSIVLGVVSVIHRHGGRLKSRGKDWPYSLAVVVCMFGMIIAGLWGGKTRPSPESLFQDLFGAVLLPVQATMFALLAFYLASAAFRSFRVRSTDAVILLVAAVLVMIGRLDDAGSLGIPQISKWILNGPNLVAKRAILIGVGLGMVSTALKVVLGIERSYLGRGSS
jgi:hypothetical protein